MHRIKLLTCLPLLLILGACSLDPHGRAVRYVENGNKFYDRGKFKEASIMYRRAIASNADPRYGEAYYRLGLTAIKLNDPGSAYKMLLNALDLQKDNADALTKLADLEIAFGANGGRQGEKLIEDALEHAKKLGAMKDGAFDSARMQGQIALLKKDAPAAIAFFEKANQLKPNQANMILAYFTALTQDNQFAKAEGVARDLISKQKDYSPIYDLLYVQYMIRKMPVEAEEVVKLKSTNNPKNVQFILQLAAHYAGQNRAAELEQTMARLNDEKTYLDGHLMAGDFYYLRLREFDKARQQYEAGLKAFPNEKLTYQKRLVELFASTNRGDDANRLLAQVLKEKPDDQEAIAMRAALRLTTGSREEVNLAVNDLQSLVTKNPNNHQLHFNLARGLLAKGETEQARIQFEETVKLRPDFVAAREFLARIHLSKADGAKALQEAENIIRLDQNHLGGHLAKSSALLILKDREKARAELEFITRTYPQNAEARYQVGYLAYEDKDFAKAAQVFGDLHKSNPRDVRGLVGVVETMASQNRLPEATKEWEAALAAEPNRQDLRVGVANLYVRGLRYDQAIKMYQEILSKDPNSADILYKLAETFRRKGDLNQAIETFGKASKANPNNPAPLLQLGLLMDGTGRREQSKPIYEQILRIQQDHPIALNNLAFIKAEEGTDLDSALSMAQRAFQAMPNQADITDTLGWVYIKKNLAQQAVSLFTDLVKRHPNNPVYRMHYGMALIQKGDRPGAKRELETALRSEPSRDEANKIQELLRTL